MEWWGYSSEHGWVVLDRNNPLNRPGIKGDLRFLRCRDWKEVDVKRADWNPPAYRYAPNHLGLLGPHESVEAAAELEAFKAGWPEVQREIQRVTQEAEAVAEALRIEEEKQQKKLAREKKKQAATATAEAST